jgi:type IV pilus assembly protein PilW
MNVHSLTTCHGRKVSMAPAQAGLTLVELMISITLCFFVVLAAAALLLSTKAGYVTQDEGARIQDTGRYALETITRAVRQAAFENWDSAQAPIVTTADMSASVAGFDARRAHSGNDIASPSTSGVINGSDVLAVRFFGAGPAPKGDGTIVNCAGFAVPAAASPATAEKARGWSIFYVSQASTEASKGEPDLYCKYLGQEQADGTRHWTVTAIASGVESFQVLYGLDTDNDGLANQFLNATAINKLDKDAGTGSNSLTNWKKVVVVKLALLLRGTQNARADTPTAQYDLFGKDYADKYASTDVGTRIKEADLPAAARNRGRKLFTATIQLRNQPLRDPT